MPDPKLKIRNPSASDDVVVVSDDKKTTVTIVKNTTASLPRVLVISTSMREHVAAGRIAFEAPTNEDEYRLGVEAVRALFQSLGPNFITAARTMPEGKKALNLKRTAYNDSWKQTDTLIKKGNAMQKGAQTLAAASALFLTPAGAQKVRDDAAVALKKVDDDFIAAVSAGGGGAGALTPAILAKYNQDRTDAQKALNDAEVALEAAKKALAGEFADMDKAIKAAQDDLGKIKPADIGAQIATWP